MIGLHSYNSLEDWRSCVFFCSCHGGMTPRCISHGQVTWDQALESSLHEGMTIRLLLRIFADWFCIKKTDVNPGYEYVPP